MSSDEEDYMSDKFLQGLSQEDIRPGVPKRKCDERTHEMYKKKLKSQEKPSDIESKRRDAGLETAISNENKGFQMLQKMGYKPGTSLGKTNEGLIEPISVKLKNNKLGLGVETKKISVTNTSKDTSGLEAEFRQSLYEKKHNKFLRRYFLKAQTSCEYLDKNAGLDNPVHDFFWPEEVIRQLRGIDDDSDEEVDFQSDINEENLEILIEHLRSMHFYCVYCASKATDLEDLNSFCPGSSMEVHSLD